MRSEQCPKLRLAVAYRLSFDGPRGWAELDSGRSASGAHIPDVPDSVANRLFSLTSKTVHTFSAVGLVLTSLGEQRGAVHNSLIAVGRSALAKQAERLRADASLLERLDRWCAETISDLVSTRRTVIGGAVRENLGKAA